MKRYSHLDWMRVLCALGVIGVHVLSHYLSSFPLHGSRWVWTMVLKHATHYQIPGFFMISGALLIRPLDAMSYGQYLKKRYARICVPFLIWSFVHWLVILVLVKGGSLNPIEFVRLLLCNGISSQYWYVYATLILYLLLPFLGELVARLDRRQLWTLIAVMAVINLLLPIVNDLLKAVSSWKFTLYSMGSMGAYLTFALVGYALNTAALPARRTRVMIYAAALLSYIVINISSYLLSETKYVNTFGETNYPLAGMMAVGVFVALRALCGRKAAPRLISVLASDSYTAYLTHMMCLRLLQLYWTAKRVAVMPAPMAMGAMAAEFVLGAVGCFGIAWLAHRLPRVSRWL